MATTQSKTSSQQPLIVIIGSTGTGKSNLAISIAKDLAKSREPDRDGSSLAAEIVNADAMQMYTGLPIITNKLPLAEQEGIPHHLIGGIGLEEDAWTVNRFLKAADRCITDIRARGRTPIIVGGTGYYVHGLLFSNSTLSSTPTEGDGETGTTSTGEADQSNAIQGSTEQEREMYQLFDGPTADIYEKLKEVDPDIASRWHPNDRRKLQRSLEIWYKTGRRASEVYAEQHKKRANALMRADGAADNQIDSLRYDPLVFWLDAEDLNLKDRLDQRVDTMLDAGLLLEAKKLHDFDKAMQLKGKVLDKSKGIWTSIGYKEMQPWLEHAEGLEVDIRDAESHELQAACIESVKAGTRRYAKRQNRFIRIRIRNALADARIDHRLFLLDCSELSRWHEDVEKPAFSITKAFLRQQPLPAPKSLSALANTTLGSMPSTLSSVRQSRHCDVCNKVLMTDTEWNNHLRSRPHKKALAAKRKSQALLELQNLAIVG